MKTVVFVIVFVLLVFRSYGKLLGDCSPQDDIPCQLYRFKGNDCFSENLKRTFTFYETNTTNFPGQPGSFDPVLSYRYLPEYSKWYPEVNLTFTTPQNGAIKYVKGFEIARYDTNSQLCYILDLSNVSWVESSLAQMNTKFRLDLFPLNPAQPAAFVFEAYALPKQENKDDNYDQYLPLFVQFPVYVPEERRKPRNWKATIMLTKDNNLGTINVKINPPPPDFRFMEYEYTLYSTALNHIHSMMNSRETSHKFTMVPTGTYQIWVKPVNGENGWPCKDLSGQVPDHCLTTKTKEFNFTYTGLPLPVKTTPTTKKNDIINIDVMSTPTTPDSDNQVTKDIKSSTTESTEVSQVQVAMVVLGVILGTVLALVVAGIIYYRRCWNNKEKTITNQEKPDMDGPPAMPGKNPAFADDIASVLTFHNLEKINNMNAEKLKFEKRPKLFLLYEDDHESHRNVVNSFATYLQQHCQCDVMCVEWQLDAHWVHQDLEKADYVVIVNSEGAFTTYMNKFGEQNESVTPYQSSPMMKRMSSINSVRNKFLHDERYDNIVMVYFDYTDEKFILPDICQGYKYRLPKHFTDFLLHIHKLYRTDNLLQYDLPLDGNHAKRPIGQQFLQSIFDAERYQRQNPKWVQKRFGYDRMCSHASDDSRFDSGFPEDFNSPVQTPKVEKPAPFSSQKEAALLHLLEGKSVCTVNPSDLGIAFHQQEPNILPPFTEESSISHLPKHRPRLSPHSFTSNAYQLPVEDTPPPPTCSTEESDFCFFPPDDLDKDFDVLSKTQSEQMKSIVDRYQAINNSETTENENVPWNQSEGYDKNKDLLLLKVNSGEVPYINCYMDNEVVSLGGESV